MTSGTRPLLERPVCLGADDRPGDEHTVSPCRAGAGVAARGTALAENIACPGGGIDVRG